MTANIKYKGSDLDFIYETPRLGAARANVNYQVSGVDISNRFTDLAARTVANGNAGTRIPPTGVLTSAGTDLSNLFAGSASQYSITTLASPAGSGLVSASTTTVLTHQFTVTFASAAAYTNYFTYGGRIQISASNVGGSGSADTALTAMFASMGTFVVYDQGTYRTGAGGTVPLPSVGGSNFGSPSGTVTFFTLTDGSPYSSSGYTIAMAANNTIGNVTALTITCTITLVRAGSVADVYTGTRTSTIQQRNYSGVVTPTQSAPTYAQTSFNW